MKVWVLIFVILMSTTSEASQRTYENIKHDFIAGEEVVWIGYYIETINIDGGKGEIYQYIDKPAIIEDGHDKCIDLSKSDKQYFAVIGSSIGSLGVMDNNSGSVVMEIIGHVDGKTEYRGESVITIRRISGNGERIRKCKT